MGWSAGAPQLRWELDDYRRFVTEMYTRFKFGSVTWNPPNVPAASTVDTVLTTSDSGDLTGLRAGMSISVTPPSAIDSGLGWCAFVATDNTLTVRLVNATTGAINPASGEWTYHGMVL